MKKRKITAHKGDDSGKRSKNFPGTRLTPNELERYNRLRGEMSSSDFIAKLMDCYENSKAC